MRDKDRKIVDDDCRKERESTAKDMIYAYCLFCIQVSVGATIMSPVENLISESCGFKSILSTRKKLSTSFQACARALSLSKVNSY